MTTADDRLRAIFATDAPPARDPQFSAAVIEALARRRFRTDLAMLAGVSLIGALCLWALWPALQPILVQTSQGLAPAAAAVVLAAGLVMVLSGRIDVGLGLRA